MLSGKSKTILDLFSKNMGWYQTEDVMNVFCIYIHLKFRSIFQPMCSKKQEIILLSLIINLDIILGKFCLAFFHMILKEQIKQGHFYVYLRFSYSIQAVELMHGKTKWNEIGNFDLELLSFFRKNQHLGYYNLSLPFLDIRV